MRLRSKAPLSRMAPSSTWLFCVRCRRANGLIERILSSTFLRSSALTRSVLLSRITSAKATCSSASSPCSSWPRKCLASTTVTMASSLVLALTSSSVYKVAAHGAADAAVVHLEHFLVGIDHEVVVDAELAEFVHDDSVFLAMLLAQDAVEQGGLAGAEIAGQQGHGHLRLGHGIPRKLAPEIGLELPEVHWPAT